MYLTQEQRRKLDLLTARDGLSLATHVRAALDRYLADTPLDARTALESTFGALPALEVPTRDEWDRD